MPRPGTPQSGDPPVIAILRKHARSATMKALLILLGLSAALQILLIALGRSSLIRLSINGRYSPAGSLALTLALLGLIFLSFLRLYRAAGKEPGSRLPTTPATVGKLLAILALIFACLLAMGTVASVLAFLIPNSQLAEEFARQLPKLMPETRLSLSSFLTIHVVVMALLSVLALTSAVSLLRTVNAARRMLKTGAPARMSKLSVTTLLILAGLIALFSLLGLFAEGGFWTLLNNLPLAGCLFCFARLINAARAELEQCFVSAEPTPNAGPELQ